MLFSHLRRKLALLTIYIFDKSQFSVDICNDFVIEKVKNAPLLIYLYRDALCMIGVKSWYCFCLTPLFVIRISFCPFPAYFFSTCYAQRCSNGHLYHIRCEMIIYVIPFLAIVSFCV